MQVASPTTAKTQITLYYDGACPLCRREAEHYRRVDAAHALALIDIAAEDFVAAAHGLDPVAVQRTLHARDADGQLHTGIDAFAAVWKTLPQRRYHAMAKLTRMPIVRPIMLLGYAAFARVRPRLPGRRRSCATAC